MSLVNTGRYQASGNLRTVPECKGFGNLCLEPRICMDSWYLILVVSRSRLEPYRSHKEDPLNEEPCIRH